MIEKVYLSTHTEHVIKPVIKDDIYYMHMVLLKDSPPTLSTPTSI